MPYRWVGCDVSVSVVLSLVFLDRHLFRLRMLLRTDFGADSWEIECLNTGFKLLRHTFQTHCTVLKVVRQTDFKLVDTLVMLILYMPSFDVPLPFYWILCLAFMPSIGESGEICRLTRRYVLSADL